MRRRSIDILLKMPAVFRYVDLEKFVSNPNVFLTRALKAGYVKRIARGFYYNTFRPEPDVEEIACLLRPPAYVSCEWAMHYHNLILQVPSVCSVITLSGMVGRRNRVTYGNVLIEYSRIKEDLFFGFETYERFNMATPEKALLDLVYLRKTIPFKDEIDSDRVDPERLLEMAAKYPKSVRQKIQVLVRV